MYRIEITYRARGVSVMEPLATLSNICAATLKLIKTDGSPSRDNCSFVDISAANWEALEYKIEQVIEHVKGHRDLAQSIPQDRIVEI